MSRWLVLALVIGCRDEQIVQLEHARDAACACKTSQCAEQAKQAIPKDHIEASPRAQQLAHEMLDCLSKLYEQERPTTDPDAPVDPVPAAPSAPAATPPGSSDPASAGMPSPPR